MFPLFLSLFSSFCLSFRSLNLIMGTCMNKCSSLISFSGAWETYQGLYRWGKSSHTQRIIIILHNNNTLAFNSSRRGGASWWHSHTPTSPSQNIEFIQALLWDPCLFCAHNCKWLCCDQVTGTPTLTSPHPLALNSSLPLSCDILWAWRQWY